MAMNDSKDQGREAFEEWMAENRPDAELYRRDVKGSTRYGEYCKRAVQDDWILWQAALATSASALARDEASVALSDEQIDAIAEPFTYADGALSVGRVHSFARALLAASSAATVSDAASVALTDERIIDIWCNTPTTRFGGEVEDQEIIDFARVLLDASPAASSAATVSAAASVDEWAFISEIAKQKPEKPDHWNSCGQCHNNIERAQDLVEARAKIGG
jgi:hypothetical protein